MKRGEEEAGLSSAAHLHRFSAPTAAPIADRPTSLSAPLARRSLALPATYLLAHISDTTSEPVLAGFCSSF